MTVPVVDASVALSWLFDDEVEPRAERALGRLDEAGALVPEVWHLEVCDALLMAERRGRLSAGEVKERLDAPKTLPIRTDEESDLQSALELAREHGLSFHDALYLELAKRERAELATLDGALGRAAVAEGVSLSPA